MWDGWNLIAELDSQNASVRTYAWGLDLSGTEQDAGGIGGLVLAWTKAGGPSGTVLQYCYDGNGNVAAALDDAGVVRASYDYGPFGETLAAEGDLCDDNPMRFSTKYTDGETGLLYYGYRYYNASTGRWLSRDPIEELGGINIYCGVGNDGINETDLWGLSTVVWDFNTIQSPTGWSVYGKGELSRSDCKVSIVAALGGEWQPPGLRWTKKLLEGFNIQIEIGFRFYVKGHVQFDLCCNSCLDAPKICGRVEAFAHIEHRMSGVRDSRGRYTRARFGAGADGGGEVCWNLCSGKVTATAGASWWAYFDFGNKYFNRSYNWAGSIESKEYHAFTAPAPLAGKCCRR